MTGIEIGLALPQYGWNVDAELIDAVIDLAERRGVHTVWVGDHVAIPSSSSADNPFHGDEGVPGLTAELPFFDAFVLLAYVAGRTTGPRIGLSALVAPLRHPLNVARLLGSLDAISRGRLTVAVVSGWWEEEFDALGLDFAERGARTDECLAVLRDAWAGGTVSLDGRFHDVGVAPSPVQEPHPPLWIGGTGRAAMRRALALGGWHAGPGAPAAFHEQVQELRAAAAGPLPEGFVLSARYWLPDFGPDDDPSFSGEELRGVVADFAALGAQHLVIGVRDREPDRYVARVSRALEWLEVELGRAAAVE